MDSDGGDLALHEACAGGDLDETKRLLKDAPATQRAKRVNAASWEGELPPEALPCAAGSTAGALPLRIVHRAVASPLSLRLPRRRQA